MAKKGNLKEEMIAAVTTNNQKVIVNNTEISELELRKRQEQKKEYNKDYALKTKNVKLSNNFHEMATKNAKKKFMKLKSYLEFLINNDNKTD